MAYTLMFQVCVVALHLCAQVNPDKLYSNLSECTVVAEHSKEDVVQSFKSEVRAYNEGHVLKPYLFKDRDIQLRYSCTEQFLAHGN